MEIWTGSISIKSGPDLKIKLLSPSQRCEKFLLRDTKLSLHSLVNPALVPLHVRAGPSVELHSTTYETSEWLKSILLRGIWLAEDNDDGIFERFDTIQCPVGLMVDVSSSSNDRLSANHVSDLLIYGILSSRVGESQSRPPSPPESSSILREDSPHAYPVKRRDLKIYAAPLSSSFADKLQSLPLPPASAAGDDTELDKGKDATFATFFPDVRSPSSKRKRILSLFEGAAEHHRRVQQRRMIPQISSIKIKKEVEDNINPAALGSPTLGQTNLRRARSLSVGGHHLSKLSESIGASETRPGSSKGVTDRRDSKSKLGMTHFPDNCESTRSQSVAPSQSTGLPKPISLNGTTSQTNSQLSRPISSESDLLATQNKDLITRTILTCMRLYGYNRQTSQTNRLTKNLHTVEAREQSHEPNRHQQRDMSVVPDFINAPAEEDDFKIMYHATYKAAMFALRYYLRTASTDTKPPILMKDTAMTAVDGILKLFCDDSLKPGS